MEFFQSDINITELAKINPDVAIAYTKAAEQSSLYENITILFAFVAFLYFVSKLTINKEK